MFSIPKNFNDFDEAGLEDELEAILSGKQPTSSKRATTTDELKPKNQLNRSNNSNATSRSHQQRQQQQQQQQQQQNQYDLDLNQIMNNLNLNANENANDDDEIDDDDFELNAQLAVIIGKQSTTTSPNKKIIDYTSSNLSTTINPSINLQLQQPLRPSPPVINQQEQANCIMLDNSHFFNQQQNSNTNNELASKEQGLIKLKDEYKALAINAKKNNDLENAKLYLRKMKETETAIEFFSSNSIVPQQQITTINTQSSANTMLQALEQRKQKLESRLQKEQSMNNTSKVRMITRILKDYDAAIKANKLGKQFDYASLPELPGLGDLPVDSLSASQNVINKVSNQPMQPMQPATIQPKLNNLNKIQQQLEKWKDEYRGLAIDAKNSSNDLEKAKLYLQKMKEMSSLIERANNGQQIDLSSISSPASFRSQVNAIDNSNQIEQQTPKVPITASSMLRELEQRKAKFENTLQKEQSMNNTSKVRMITRILKDYEAAIKSIKLAKEFDYESLPVPPGFEELSNDIKSEGRSNEQSSSTTKAQSTSQQTTTATQQVTQTKSKAPFKRTVSVNNKQLDYLLQRQRLFKEAAVESNKKDERSQALDYLRKAKGFDTLIDAVQNGLPIDVSHIPIPPQLDTDDFVMVSKEEENGELNKNNSYMNLDKEEHYR